MQAVLNAEAAEQFLANLLIQHETEGGEQVIREGDGTDHVEETQVPSAIPQVRNTQKKGKKTKQNAKRKAKERRLRENQ